MKNDFLTQCSTFCSNPVLQASLLSWLAAQFIKTILHLFTHQIHNVKELLEMLFWRTGGMPSSHSSLVTTMTTCIGFRSGVSSDLFILACCFMLVVIRDAVGVRRSSGDQARVLNEIGMKLEKSKIIDFSPVKQINGHNPGEVCAGVILGFIIGLLFSCK